MKGRRTAGTCEWIKDNETYQSWIDGDVQCLWITGGPGKGKTMLSIFLTEELERRTQENKATELLMFFFCTPDEKHSNAVAILRGLAYQFVRMRPNLVSHILSDFESAEKTQETLNSPNALWMVLEKLLKAPDLGTVFCVLDGLDECDEESSSLLADKFYEYFLESSNPSGVQFKLAIVSRKIDGLDAFPQVKLDPDNNENVNSDIKNFIASSVKRLERIRGFNDYRESIETTLLDRAQGTFLWVGFVITELSRKKTCIQIMETLEGIPQGLHGIYSRMLAQIEVSRRSAAFNILQWATVAVRPLTLSELGEAIHLPPTTKITKDQAIRDHITLCGDILTIHDQQVSLVHQSARDYLLQSEADSDPMLKEFQIQAEHAHAMLAETPPAVHETLDGHNETTPLSIAARRGHTVIVQLLLANGADGKDKALGLAAREGHTATVQLLLANGADGKDEALKEAALSGHPDIVQLLLANGADNKDEAMQYAVYRGDTAIVRLLIANGAGIESGMRLMAVTRGHFDILQLLLTHSAGNLKDAGLYLAVDVGRFDIVQLLLANGADGKDEALEEAAYRGRLDIVQLLLKNGANITDKALEAAVHNDHTTIVQLLLDNRAVIT
ncbi:hypothetical protein THARTR1_02012 [Trichoderma harzianum]|uniref:NACHT domain-containing protein n=1 Tax=Trichoderma harzianum TaxID=5544 RepID=A0A2K0UJA9_TRIHA|nr:hypothetical protein THARTR1_02012 [Trichoderma harzianum]